MIMIMVITRLSSRDWVLQSIDGDDDDKKNKKQNKRRIFPRMHTARNVQKPAKDFILFQSNFTEVRVFLAVL